MIINPLVFIPSVRQIPRVMESWGDIPYDKFLVRMMLEPRAYKTGREFFIDHEEYTHIVIAPDDMVIDYDSFMRLKNDVIEYGFSNISGLANLGQNDPDIYSCKPVGVPLGQNTKGSYYEKHNLPDSIFEVGFTGFACQWIERKLVEKLSFTGWCNGGKGCMDAQFSKELSDMGIPQLVDPDTYFPHLRNEQYDEVRAWKNAAHEPDEGWTEFIRYG